MAQVGNSIDGCCVFDIFSIGDVPVDDCACYRSAYLIQTEISIMLVARLCDLSFGEAEGKQLLFG